MERPILFSGEMVNAILSGAKTQTRRVVKPPPAEHTEIWNREKGVAEHSEAWFSNVLRRCPYGHPGDLLWVRETWFPAPWSDGNKDFVKPLYRADAESDGYVHGFDAGEDKWKPSIFMPRWASRITLKVEGVRVQRLQDISEEDCYDEGIDDSQIQLAQTVALPPCTVNIPTPKTVYRDLWDSLNKKKHPWSSNPWVWAVTFSKEDNG